VSALPPAAFEPGALMGPGAAAPTTPHPAAPAGDMFARMISQVNQDVVGSQAAVQELALGDAQNLHQVMIRLEEAKLGFQLLVQVRNRLLEAYQEIMKTQV